MIYFNGRLVFVGKEAQLDSHDNICLVTNLKSLRRRFRTQLTLTILVALSVDSLMFCAIYRDLMIMQSSGTKWYSYVLSGIMVTLGFFYTRQAINPIVSDKYSNWVNLRTGRNNLCDESLKRVDAV